MSIEIARGDKAPSEKVGVDYVAKGSLSDCVLLVG